MTGRIRVLLADDHALMREMLVEKLSKEADMEVVGSVDNANDALSEALRLKPDVVVLDIDMPGLTCFTVARQIQERSASTRILILSAFFHDRYVEEALQVQASAYVTKSEPPETVVKAIRAVATGGSYFSPEVEARIVVDSDGAHLASSKRSRVATLTPRELEVLRYIAQGLSKSEIAKLMHLSTNTVHCHSANLMTKLDIHDRVELSRFAIREGLAEA